MKSCKIFLLLPFITLLYVDVCAQTDTKMRHHIIIAIDEFMPGNWAQNSKTLNSINSLLFVEKIDGEPICRQGDLLSIMGFGVTAFDRNMNHYVFPLKSRGTEWKCVEVKNVTDVMNVLYRDWKTIAAKDQNPHRNSHGQNYSMISLIKQYALTALQNHCYDQYVNRTFIIVVTDKKYNGGSVYEEAESLRNISAKTLLKTVRDVQKEYFLYRYGEKKDPNNNRFIELYEFQPHQEHLTLSSMWDYEPAYEVKRYKKGDYKLTIADSLNVNAHHKIIKIKYSLLGQSGDIIEEKTVCADVSNSQYIPIDNFKWEYDTSRSKDIKSVEIRAWVTLEDGVYNSTVLTPSSGAPDFLGKKGLCVTIPVKYEEIGTFCGFIPIPDWLMLRDNQEEMSLILNIATVLLFGIGIIALYGKIQTYNPKETEMEIRKIK